MKKTLLLSIAVLVGIALQAQVSTFPWTEGFENGQGDWTFVDQDGDGHNWGIQTSTFYAHGGSKNLQSHSYLNDQALTPDNYAFSPAIVLPNETGFVLEFYVATFNNYYYAEHMSVYVATNNTVASLADLSPVEEFTMTGTNTTTNYAHHVVGLNDYAGQTIYIVFRHHNCTDLDYILVDDVTIRQTTVPVISLSGPDAAMSGEDAVFSVALSEGATPTYTWSSTLAAAGQATISTNAAGDTATIAYSGGGTDLVTVTATNAYGSTTASKSVEVTDCGSASALPWTADFGSNDGVQCWQFVDNDENNYNWSRSGSGSNAYIGSRGADDWAVTPPLQMPENAAGVTLEWSVRGYNGCTYEVWVSPSGDASVSSFTDSLFGETYTNNSYANRTLDLSAYGGQQVRIAFRHTHLGGNNNSNIRLRGIGVRQIGLPAASIVGPAVMELDSAYSFAAVVNEGSLENIAYSWSSLLADAGLATIVETDSTMTISYTSGGNDEITVVVANNVGSVTVTMPVYVVDCQPVASLPWTEGFENPATLQCWTLIDADNDSRNWEIVAQPAYAHSGSAAIRSLSYDQGNIAPDNIMISPSITLPASGNFVLQYYAGAGSQNFFSDHLSVYVVSANTQAVVEAATPVEDFTLTAADFYQNGLNVHSVALNEYAGQTVYIAFRHNFSFGQNSVIIDDISIRQTDAPTVAIGGVPTASVDVDQVFRAVLVEGATEGLAYSWQSAMAEAGQASIVEMGDSIMMNYMFEGTDTIVLTAVNAYGSMSDTMLVSVVDFGPVSEFPYATGFEADDDNGSWTISAATNAWAFGPATAGGGSAAMYISPNGGATYGYTANAATHAYAIRAMNLAAGQYVVGYDWRCVGENFYGTINDYMRVFLAPASFDPQAGAATTGLNASSLPAGFIALDGGAALLGQQEWTTQVATIDVSTSGVYNLVFYWRNDGSASDGVPAAIDNLVVNANTCPAPSALTVVATDANSVSLQWQPGGSETEWVVSVGGTSESVYGTPSHTVYGLDANADYQISVRGVCAPGDTSLAASVDAHTGCAGNSCEFSIAMTDSYGDGWYSSGVVVMQGGAAVATATIVHTGYDNFADTANISVCAGQPIALLWASMPSFDHECGFSVSDAMGTEIYSIYDCSALAEGDTIIVFDADCNAEVVAPEPGPQPQPETCNVPVDLHLVSATTTSVILDWTPTGNESQWQLQVDGGQPVSVVSHPYELGGLAASTTYNVKVRAVCSSDLTSDWSAAVSVSTADEDNPEPGPGEGIADAIAASIAINPNPASSTVSISAEGLRSVVLVDMTGRECGEWNAEGGEVKVDVGQMARGVYFVRLHGDGFTATRKLIVGNK